MFAENFSTISRTACGIAVAFGALALATTASAQSTEEPLFAVLNGNNECDSVAPPGGPVCRKGDPDGFGSAMILFPAPVPGPTPGPNLCYSIIVDNLAPAASAAHIHVGNATFNGPVVVPLARPINPGASDPGVSAGCVTVAAATLSAIMANPTGYYVNVHTTSFPNGAVRGQLF